MKKIILGVVLVAATLLVVALVGMYLTSDKSEASYQSYSDAEKAEATAKGWVPDFVPRSATRITEKHWLDSNDHVIEFSFDPADRESILASFAEIPRSDVERVQRSMEAPPWSELSASDGLTFYRRKDDQKGGGYLAIDGKQNRAQFWNDQ